MKVVCLLGIREAWATVEHALTRLRPSDLHIILVYVISQEQRPDLLRVPGGLGRTRHPPAERSAALDQADVQAGQTPLQRASEAARHYGVDPQHIEQRLLRGRPDQIIVELAATEHCDLVVLRASTDGHVRLPPGPASIDHVARFILDHTACDVLLIKSMETQQRSA